MTGNSTGAARGEIVGGGAHGEVARIHQREPLFGGHVRQSQRVTHLVGDRDVACEAGELLVDEHHPRGHFVDAVEG